MLALKETSLHPESPSGAFHLKSGFLKISEDSCLEFWYHKPNKKSSELKVLLEGDILQTLIWTSETSSIGDWRQVFIPLTKQSDKDNIQVIFELLKGLQDDEQTAFDRIGIRKGQCGPQCQRGGTFWTDKSTRCTCTDEQLICSHVPRSKDTFGTCHVASDPHYTTFDGVSFQFESPCTYVLSKVCDDSGLLPEFAVEVQNENKGDSHISSIQQVNINVHGLTVTMVRTERRKVMVNGIWKNLPLLLKGNRVTVNAQGDALVLQTDFKLSVFYLRSSAVQVIVPSHYSNRICGMCGNFNHETEDDIKIPDRSLMQDTHVLGQSVCEEPTLPRVCTDAEEQKYASEVYCGMLTSRQGAFSTCSSVLNADSFFRSCMFDMCTTHGDPAALCNAIEAFSATCDKVGISVMAWRNTTFCHSFFRSCMFDMCTTHGDPAALCNAIEAFSATCDKVGISVMAWRNTTFCRNRVTVNAQGDALVLQTDFKLSVFYLRSSAVQVIVPSHYSNRICGMCGNFNHETEDDIKIPDRSLMQDTHVLGQSVCEEPTLPRVCTDAEEQKYASEVYCGMLTSRQGAFSTPLQCH
ncbi:zonadhesin-like [Sinocyclocheilus grahami]|uniref:zonadhesin-like n=1 Tax=Sinocyclocheilus grahami TaxID=75366 RepID=UPI0007AC853E|nr:PREDICTED: zonadhesin-like [Sinocyclocheilus grahami]